MNKRLVKTGYLFDFVKDMDAGKPYPFNLPNEGVVFSKIDKDTYDYLMKEAMKLREEDLASSDVRSELIGHLSNEYRMNHASSVVMAALEKTVSSYLNSFDYSNGEKINFEVSLTDMWVNFMKKHDHNPPHVHKGSLSFVIWMKIPYDLEKELDVHSKSNATQNSCFSFLYRDVVGGNRTVIIPIDKTYEGVVCLFSSNMVHYVCPFYTSDEDRISIAGNLSVKKV